MLNLLPQTEKSKLIGEYKKRYRIVIALSVLLLAIAAIAGLFPSYTNKKAERETLIKENKKEDAQDSIEMLAEAERLEASNKVLADYLVNRVDELKGETKTSKVMQDILAKSNDSIVLFGVSIDSKLVTVKGVAATRADLIAFQNSLKSEPLFKDSTLPVSDLARSTRAEFTITINLL